MRGAKQGGREVSAVTCSGLLDRLLVLEALVDGGLTLEEALRRMASEPATTDAPPGSWPLSPGSASTLECAQVRRVS